jgi:hypothetical protein
LSDRPQVSFGVSATGALIGVCGERLSHNRFRQEAASAGPTAQSIR